MGYVVERANILDRLFHSLQISMKNVPGSLAVATMLTCAMFATANGIVGAVVTLMGLLAFPAMLRAGYDVKLSAGVVCAGGCLGIQYASAFLLIVYAATAGVSAVKLYAAAFIPGFMLAGFYILYIIARAMINPALAPKLPKEQPDGASCPRRSMRSWQRRSSRFRAADHSSVYRRRRVRPGDAIGSGRRGRAGQHGARRRLWCAQLHHAAGIPSI